MDLFSDFLQQSYGLLCTGRHRVPPRGQAVHAREQIGVTVINFAGEEMTRLSVEPTSGLAEVRAALRESIGWRRAYAKVLYGSGADSVELTRRVSLQDIGVTDGAKLTLVSLPPARIALRPRAVVLELHDIDTGACVLSMDLREVFDGGRLGLAFSPNGLHVLPVRRCTAEIWCMSTGRRLRVLRGHEDVIHSVAFSHDGHRCITASEDGTARLWIAATGECLGILHSHGSSVYSAAFSHCGHLCITASTDQTARLWIAATGECLGILYGHGSSVCSAIFSPDDHQCLTTSSDRTARLWSAGTGECSRILRGHEDTVCVAAFSPTGLQILTGSSDRTARLWITATGECSHVLPGHALAVCTVAFSPDGILCLTAAQYNSQLPSFAQVTARLWRVADGKCVRKLETYGAVAAFAPETLDLCAEAQAVEQREQRQRREANDEGEEHAE